MDAENGCSGEQNPSWPADWDALLNPTLTAPPGTTITPTPGGAPGAGTFKLPWGAFGAFSGVFKSTFVDSNSTILKQGSKNSNDISTWVVATQNAPPKDAIVAAAIATYIGPPGDFSGHELLYNAVTRFSPNGSATLGIWLFQETVQVCSSGANAGKALCGSDGVTLAQHKIGDTFLFITFGGSGFASIQVASWVNANGPAGSLGPPESITLCPNADDNACEVTNETNTVSLPTLFNVSGANFPGFANGQVPPLQFQEGGIDLNAVLGHAPPCFSTVMFASVSSGSSPATASLKAIVLGNLNTCAISATKACAAGTANISAGTVTYPISGSVSNVGGGVVQDLSLSDKFQGNTQSFDSGTLACSCPSGDSGCSISGSDCTTASVDPGSSVDYSAEITTGNGGSDIVTATMSGSGGGSATAQSNTATCAPITFPSSVSITKNCGIPDGISGAVLVATGGKVSVEVGVSGTVTNGSSTLPLSSVNVYDCVGADFALQQADPDHPGCFLPINTGSCATNGGTLRTVSTGGSLDASGTSSWSDSYFPSVAPSCGPYNFDDQVLVQASCASSFCDCANVQNVQNQTCPLCPGPTCSP